MARVTEAEAELDKRARKLVKKNPGMSFAQGVAKALEDDPGLYTKYEQEIAAGTTYLAPEYMNKGY